MDIGFVTNCLGETTIHDAVKVAVDLGFDCLEVGPSIGRDREAFHAIQNNERVYIHSFIYGRNFLSHLTKERQVFRNEIYRLLDLAIDVGVRQITTSTGVDPDLSLDDNIKVAIEFWEPLFEQALDAGVRLALEFCPAAGNFALGPYAWERLFAATERWPNFGLNYDPSHLLWQFIDPYTPIAEFSQYIFSVHIKDTIVWHDRLAKHGILTPYALVEETAHGTQESRATWWEYRLPGEGELDLTRFLKNLNLIGYEGVLLLENEDKGYVGSTELVVNGLQVGLDTIHSALQSTHKHNYHEK